MSLTSADIEAFIDSQLSRQAIQDLIANYSTYVDTRQKDKFPSLWHDDATFSTVGSDTVVGAAAIGEMISGTWAATSDSRHYPSNIVINFADADHGHSTAHVISLVDFPGGLFQLYVASYDDH
ncbi:MAG: hypothetical protein JWO10_1875, partial [Microbacteriaceae bacterium]|nr:hypothetical protein [Microbacteriaceae bacterium]